ncbi:dispersed gene family protein 1 (DGF-1), partial [Trypanosoma cruzi]
DAVASPLVLHATSLLQTQLSVSNTVLRSLQAGGSAVYVGGGVDLLSSAVVLDGVLLEASGGPTASAMRVASSSRLSLRSHSVFSVTNVSVLSSGGGIVLGERLAVLDSVLRFVRIEGSVASSLVRCDGGTVSGGGWLELRDVWAVGEACLPFDMPVARAGGGAEDCVSGVTLTESVTVGGGRATACFDSVVFSGPITVAVDLRSMDAFADALNVTLRHCVLAGGSQLRIGGLSENTARLMPHAFVNMTNVTSLEGTIVLHGTMPLHSNVLLANSTLRATVGGS